MRSGRFTQVPERPDDLEELWKIAAALTPETTPFWSTSETIPKYRYLSSVCESGLSSEDRRDLLEELDLLRSHGLATDDDMCDPRTHRIYVPGPSEADIWSIGIFTGDSPFTLSAPASVPNPVLTASDVTDVVATFVADPFMLEYKKRWFMFFEIMNWQLRRGQIGLAESEDGVKWAYRGVVLDEPFHLSYPGVFQWKDRFYMIPETNEAKSVRLYEATSFPAHWRHVATLLEGQHFCDASVVRHQETWWLFVDTSPKRNHDRLSLYYADDLAGPWVEHPQSPIVARNPRIARPGGRVIVWNGCIFRFSQNCSSHYGTEVLAFEITELTPHRYAERPLADHPVLSGSGAGWNAGGMHHIDPHPLCNGRWIACVDGWTRTLGWAVMTDSRLDVARGLMMRDIERVVPENGVLLIADKGRGVVISPGRRSIPFPERDGEWGGYPADDAAAIAELERLRMAGAQFLVFPSAMRYWLDAYPGLLRHLSDTSRCLLHNERVLVFGLSA